MPFLRFILITMILLLSVCPESTAGQAVVRDDSSHVTVRAPTAEVLESYRSDPDFAYDQEAPPETTWWGQVRRWIWDRLAEVFGRVPGRVYEWLLYAVIAVVLFLAVTRLLRMSPRALFSGKSDRPAATFELLDGDILVVDFEAQIQEALAARSYRRAVRLYYLKALQHLAERDLIDWQPDKTNHHYLAELQASDLHPSFAEMTRLFEYIWYGDFSIDEAAFHHAHRSFARFETALELNGAGQVVVAETRRGASG